MRFSESQLDRWAEWHSLEAVYTTNKHQAHQAGYLLRSVATDQPYIPEIADTYLRRASLRSLGGVALDKVGGLRIIQDVGKAAQTYLAYSVSALTHDRPGSQDLDNFPDVIGDWRQHLQAADWTEPDYPYDDGPRAGLLQRAADIACQANLSSLGVLRDNVRTVALPVCAGLINLAEKHGWPRPGISSTEETQLWIS
jgi:hypothetical protein